MSLGCRRGRCPRRCLSKSCRNTSKAQHQNRNRADDAALFYVHVLLTYLVRILIQSLVRYASARCLFSSRKPRAAVVFGAIPSTISAFAPCCRDCHSPENTAASVNGCLVDERVRSKVDAGLRAYYFAGNEPRFSLDRQALYLYKNLKYNDLPRFMRWPGRNKSTSACSAAPDH